MVKKTAKKSTKKTSVKSVKKGYSGLKMYVVIGLFAIVAISLIIFSTVWNSAVNPKVAVATLPDTGDVVSYYTTCIIDNKSGVGSYADRATPKCAYVGKTVEGYDYETTDMFLKCEVNTVIKMNVCTDGITK